MTEQAAQYLNLPWRLTVAGNPIPKGRPRVVNGNAYTPKRTREYEAFVRDMAALHWLGEPTRQEVSVKLSFYRENRRRVDLDNLAKAVLDALNGVVWEDDAQIAQLFVERDVCRNHPSVEIVVEAL